MIFDGENMFFNKQALSAADITSDVVKVGVGESYEPMKLFLGVDKDAGEGTASTVLQTAADAAFTTPKTLGTYTQVPLSTPVPRGNLGYLRLVVTSTYATGKVTAGLVLDDDIPVRG